MSAFSIIAAAASLAASPTPHAAVQAGYEELSRGADAAAIAAISHAEKSAGQHPARLINLGIAFARRGDTQRARQYFETAYRVRERVYLETANGDWIDSRILAQRALAQLDAGLFADQGRIARK